MRTTNNTTVAIISFLLLAPALLHAQTGFQKKFRNSNVYAGLEVGSKGVKLSLVEIAKRARESGAFNTLKDTSVNTDFISFNQQNYEATLNAMTGLYNTATQQYEINPANVITAVSSGVKGQADKMGQTEWIDKLVMAFQERTGQKDHPVTVISIEDEARLSHLGIVPSAQRYKTFLIDIGSGNAKGGYFPYGTTEDFKLFGLEWGTKSTANAAEAMCGQNNSLDNYKANLQLVLEGIEHKDLIYAVNKSGAYPKSDNIALSGGISWALANLMHPELANEAVVPVSYKEVETFLQRLSDNFSSVSPEVLAATIPADLPGRDAEIKMIKTIHKVFDQKALMAGGGLLLKVLRQFESVNESKKYYLVKNGQVGWISAFVEDQQDQ